jgi:tungstate transport system substrate-binding protein
VICCYTDGVHMTRTRRGLAALTALGVALGLGAVLSPTAGAADKVDLNVVGTSDVSDSKLMDYLKPKFEAAYPQYNLLYSGNATSKAISLAKGGDYDAMIVHAASVENQFVHDGWSAEQYGRAVFWGDFVLLGPASDPAGVLTSSNHDVVTAFEKIAAAGAEGKAHFISRAAAPGTTVQEHAIWALTDDAKVAKCNVSSTLGGGETPSTDPSGTDCPSQTNYPSWYNSGDRKQAENIQYADQCSVVAGAPDCYVLTDRGTYQYMASTGALSTLKIVVRNNDATARGGIPALVNSFHAYAINPDAFNDPGVKAGINLTGAKDFLNWLSSPAGQAAVGSYLNASNDAPFLPSAAPKLTVTPAPASVKSGSAIDLTGTLSNVVPGTPHLDGVPVTLVSQPAIGPGIAATTVATATTDASGNYAFHFTPRTSLNYRVDVGQITKIENSSLDPVFGDILQPTSTSAGRTIVTGKTKLTTAKLLKHRKAQLKGKLSPQAPPGAVLKVYGKKGTHHAKLLKTVHLSAGASTYKTKVKLKKGTWKLQVRYSQGTAAVPSKSPYSTKLKVS